MEIVNSEDEFLRKMKSAVADLNFNLRAHGITQVELDITLNIAMQNFIFGQVKCLMGELIETLQNTCNPVGIRFYGESFECREPIGELKMYGHLSGIAQLAASQNLWVENNEFQLGPIQLSII